MLHPIPVTASALASTAACVVVGCTLCRWSRIRQIRTTIETPCTAAAVSAALTQSGMQIRCVKPSSAEGWFSERFEVEDGCGTLWFVKTLPVDPDLLCFTKHVGLMEREQRFYNMCAEMPDLPKSAALAIPRLRYSSSNGMLVISHLAPQGFAACDARRPLDTSDVKVLLQALAEFHTLFPSDFGGFSPRHAWPLFGENIRPLLQAGITELETRNWLSPELLRGLYASVDDIIQTLSEPIGGPHVFCHGDAWLSNWQLSHSASLHGEPCRNDEERKPAAALVDFQFVGPGPAANDVEVLLLTSVEPSKRRQALQGLRAHYTACRVAACRAHNKPPPLPAFSPEHVRHGAALAAVVILSDISLYPREQVIAAVEEIAKFLLPERCLANLSAQS